LTGDGEVRNWFDGVKRGRSYCRRRNAFDEEN
jgi:hypothetical protein